MKYFKQTSKSGFTIVELTVVVIIIGLLASISYFGINSWRDRIAESEVKSDLTNIVTAMKNAKNWGDDFPVFADGTTFTGTGLAKNVYIQSQNVTITYYHGDAGSYCIDGQSTARSITYHVTDQNTQPTTGDCASSIVVATLDMPVISAATVEGSTATVSWSAISGAASYQVRKKLTSNSTWDTPTATLSTVVPVPGLTLSVSYDFQVQAVASDGTTVSPWSSTVARQTLATPTGFSVAADPGVCGNSGGTDAWMIGTASWQSVVGVTSYKLDGRASTTYPNTGGIMSVSSVESTSWAADMSGSGQYTITAIGPNGERSSGQAWVSEVYPPYTC